MVGCAAVACKNNSSFKTSNGAESLRFYRLPRESNLKERGYPVDTRTSWFGPQLVLPGNTERRLLETSPGRTRNTTRRRLVARL